jgi:putative alpha-1,2-mannosidase
MKGGVWEFVMDSKPNKKRGISADAKPYSLTDGKL